MKEFVEASEALVSVLRSFMFGKEQIDYAIPSIALHDATQRYNAAMAALKADKVI